MAPEPWAVLFDTSLFTTFNVARLKIPPPRPRPEPGVPAVLPLISESFTVMMPKFSIPPP